MALPQGDDMRTRQLRLKATTAGRVLGALGLFAAVFAVTGSPASAAAAPRNLADIDVTFTGSNGDYVVAALTKSGTVSVEVVSCEGDICQKHGWTNLSGALTSIAIKTARSGDVVLLGRSSSGRTWYRRGECSNHACSWSGWSGLGGNLRSVRSAESNSYGCINVAGLSPSDQVYRSKICLNGATGWSSAGGALKQMDIDASGDVFGTTSSRNLWWNRDNIWHYEGGKITQPVSHDVSKKCGLSPGSQELWCRKYGSWTNYGGTWRKLDDGQTIGVATNWSAQDFRYSGNITNHGGSVNQLANDNHLWVGVSGGLTPWYHNGSTVTNGWLSL